MVRRHALQQDEPLPDAVEMHYPSRSCCAGMLANKMHQLRMRCPLPEIATTTELENRHKQGKGDHTFNCGIPKRGTGFVLQTSTPESMCAFSSTVSCASFSSTQASISGSFFLDLLFAIGAP